MVEFLLDSSKKIDKHGLRFLVVLIVSICLATLSVSAGSITQGYKASTDLSVGSVVSLTSSSSQDVEKTNINNDSLLVGVVVDEADSLLDVLPTGSQVRVATTGDVKLLVSTVNGDITSGSRLIASPLSGIATVDYPPAPGAKYIAVANSDFNKDSSDASKISVTQNDGTQIDVYVGTIEAKLLLGSRTSSNEDKNVIVALGQKITGKNVNILQVLVAGAVFITSLGLSGLILYSSIRGSFVSIGRNPLSKDSILSGLFKVAALSVVIFGVGASVAYFILQI